MRSSITRSLPFLLRRKVPTFISHEFQSNSSFFPRHFSENVAVASTKKDVYIEFHGPPENGIAVIYLDRDQGKNSLSRKSLSELVDCVAQVRSDPTVRCVIFRSRVARVFCAGADLKERATMSQPEVASFVHSLRTTFRDVHDLPMPTIAVIEGAALGGGLELAMCCDFRIGSEDAIVGLPETGLAIIPGAGGTQFLTRAIGVSKAKELIFTARRLSAKEGYDYNILTRVTPVGTAFDQAVALAEEIAVNGPIAVKMAKFAINKGSEVDLASGLAIEQACYAQVIPTQDRIEGLTAFREKRKPKYTGK